MSHKYLVINVEVSFISFRQVLKDKFICAVDSSLHNLPQKALTLITRYCETIMMDKLKKSCA